MINEKAFHHAELLATNLEARRVSLTPKNDSVVDMMNKHTARPAGSVDPLTGRVTYDVELYATLNNRVNHKFDEVSLPDEHCVVQDEISERVISGVRADLTVARTLVLPAVEELVKYVEEKLSKMTFSELLNIEIRCWNPAEPIKTGSMDRLLEPYADVEYGNPTLGVRFPDQSHEQILEHLRTGNSSIDEDVKKWIATKDVDWVHRRFTQVFGIYQLEDGEALPTFNSLMRSGELDVVDTTLLTFLIANRLVDSPVEGADISLDGWIEKMSALRNQAGKRLLGEVERVAGFIKAGNLIMKINSERQIVVFEPVYKEWLQNGGSNDVIFGLMISNGFETTIDALESKSEQYRAAWQAQVARLRMSEDSLRFNAIRDALKEGFLLQLQALGEEDRAKAPASNLALTTRFNQILNEFSRPELDDLFTATTKLMCATRFANSNAYQFLMLLNRVTKINPDLNLRDASTIATISYVTQWLLDQCDVTVKV